MQETPPSSSHNCNACAERHRFQSFWWLLLGCLGAAILATLVLKWRAVTESPVVELARAPASCDLRQGACTARFVAGASGGGRVQLSIQPAEIPLVEPLRVRVRLIDMDRPRRVEIDFSGVDMNMGFNRVLLAPTGRAGSYVGTAMLPLCVRQRMQWEARVLLFEADRARAAAFRFETRRPG